MNDIYVQHALEYHSAALDKGSFYMKTQTKRYHYQKSDHAFLLTHMS